MAFYTVLMPPPETGGGAADRLEKTVFLKDGFVLFAFVFTGLWLLAKRLWLAFAVFLVIWVAVAWGGRAIGIHPLGLAAAQVLIGLFLGLEGHALIERKLLRKGWRLAGVVEGKEQDTVERRFFESLNGPAGEMAVVPPAAAYRAGIGQAASRADGAVLGLFPQGQGRGGA